MQVSFEKLHGLGNDFVFIDDFEKKLELTADQVAWLCDRHFGIGSDGVILVRQSPRPECTAYMHYINSDGSLAEMCGNGIRCFTKYLIDHDYLPREDSTYVADTLRGPLSISYQINEAGTMSVATVDMGEPILEPAQVPVAVEANAQTEAGVPFAKQVAVDSPWGEFKFTCVSMGNPHAICFLDNMSDLPSDYFVDDTASLESFDLNRIGAFFECNPVFPAKTNVEIISVAEDGLHMRVFERGCGETLACGTGACATLVASVLTGRSERSNRVILRGGPLQIEWADNNHVFMTGPAQTSFTGTVEV